MYQVGQPGSVGQPQLDQETKRAQERAGALESAQKAATSHAKAVERATQVPGLELVPQALVDAILAAGKALDQALLYARRLGHEPQALAALTDLHPTYVRELLTYGVHGEKF